MIEFALLILIAFMASAVYWFGIRPKPVKGTARTEEGVENGCHSRFAISLPDGDAFQRYSNPKFLAFIERSCRPMELVQDHAHAAMADLGYVGHDISGDKAKFLFTNDRNVSLRGECVAQFDKDTSVMTWAWAKPDQFSKTPIATRAKSWGNTNAFLPMVSERIHAPLEDAWHLVKLAAWISNATDRLFLMSKGPTTNFWAFPIPKQEMIS